MSASDEPHPQGCRCETCEAHRARQQLRESYPERARRLRHIRGQDTEPIHGAGRIPDGMTEREARARGLIE